MEGNGAALYPAPPFLRVTWFLRAGRLLQPPEDNMLINLFAARWLGAGLALEAFLSLAAGLYAITLIATPYSLSAASTVDIAVAWGAGITVPLVTKSLLTGAGLIMNILGDPKSRLLRILGAMLGSIIWFGLSLQLFLNEQIGGFFVFTLLAYLASIRIVCMSWANIPEPGLMQAFARLFP